MTQASAVVALSVIIPVHNAAAHLHTPLAALASQTDLSAEVIVVDDGSDEDHAEAYPGIVAKYRLPSLRWVRQEAAGVSVARNRGLAEAIGEYVLFLDSDDSVAAGLTERLQAVTSNLPDMICWGFDVVGPNGRPARASYLELYPQVPELMTGSEALRRRVVDGTFRIWTASAAYRRTFLTERQLSYTPGCRTGEDKEFAFRALAAAESVRFVPEVLSWYHRHPGSATSQPSVTFFHSVLAGDRIHDLLAADPRSEVRSIAQHFGPTKLLDNYFLTLESVLTFRRSPTVGGLLREIDAQCPAINLRVQSVLTTRRRQCRYIPAGWRLFGCSPDLWWLYRRLCRALDSALPRQFRSTSAAAARRHHRRMAT